MVCGGTEQTRRERVCAKARFEEERGQSEFDKNPFDKFKYFLLLFFSLLGSARSSFWL